MRIIGLIISFLAAINYVHGQDEIIELKNEHVKIESRDFYIRSVIDGRSDKSRIGFAQVGLFNKKVNANFKTSIENTFQSYFDNVLKKGENQLAIVLKVIDFFISEKTIFTSETGRAEIKVEFYILSNNQLGKIYETEAFYEESGIDVTKGHERRIRKVLTICLNKFYSSNWRQISPDFKPIENIINTVSPVDSLKISEHKPIKINNIISFSKAFGINANGWGLNYYGYINKDEKNKWIVPYSLSIENSTINPDLFKNTNYQSLSMGYFIVGITGLRKITDIIYFQLQGKLPIGNETLIDFYQNKKTNFIIGLNSTQGFVLIPSVKYGLTLSAGIYETFLTSEIYKNDIGFKFEAGIKF